MIHALIGKKIDQTQRFLEDGMRIPVTEIAMPGNPVIAVKTQDKAGYTAVQLGFGTRKRANKALLGHAKGAKQDTAPYFLQEVRMPNTEVSLQIGDIVKPSDVFAPGDIVDVSGVSKGKGFAGGVKRHQFKGGPRTHGQSDRERAPGSIGQTTTPGRVYKGKRMAGNMGHDVVTVKNLQIVAVSDNNVMIKGLVPGPKNAIVTITKRGTNKKFVPLYEEKVEQNTGVEEVEQVEKVDKVEVKVEEKNEQKEETQ